MKLQKEKKRSGVKTERLLSLDALRGFDMFWITGGATIVSALATWSGADWLQTLNRQFQHVEWVGFRFEDLIFPLFMFISGVAIPFALIAKRERGVPRSSLTKKVFKRAIILVVLGMFYNGVFQNGFENPRFASVLGQIGLAYLFASLIVLYTKSFKQRLYWLLGILAGYSFIQLLVPVPGFGAGVLTPEGCINGYIDRLLLPGRLHGGVYDPEGLLCVVSATGITLMGTFAGNILRNRGTTETKKVVWLLAIGTSLVVLALLLSLFYPIIKKCWTTTFNLLAGGISFLLMALFYWLIDVKGWKKWAFFFRVIGLNSIFIYLLYRFVDVGKTCSYFFGWTTLLGNIEPVIHTTLRVLLVWLLLYYMYRKKIFLRV
ncbi:MAG: acyltransferase family protein [Fermentimonas sp.]|jgi:predicted acyltransferase